MKSDFDEFGVREGVFARERIIVCFPGTQDVFGLVVVEGEAGVGDDDLGFAGDGGHEEGFVVFGVLFRSIRQFSRCSLLNKKKKKYHQPND